MIVMRYTDNLDLRNFIRIDDFIIKLKEMIDIVYSNNNTSIENKGLYNKRGIIYSLIYGMDPFRVGNYLLDYNLHDLSKTINDDYANPYFLIYKGIMNDIIFNKKNLYLYYNYIKRIIIYFTRIMDEKFLYDLKFIKVDPSEYYIQYYNKILGFGIKTKHGYGEFYYYYLEDKKYKCKDKNECILYLIDEYN